MPWDDRRAEVTDQVEAKAPSWCAPGDTTAEQGCVGQGRLVMNLTASLTVGSVLDLTFRVALKLEPVGAAFVTVTWAFTLKVAPGASTGVV